MNDHLQLPSDLALEAQTRAGSTVAWNELRDRHVDAIEALARARTGRRARDSVDDVFVRLRDDITTPAQRPDDERIMPIRPRAIGLLTGGAYGPRWSPPVSPDGGIGPYAEAAPDVDPAQQISTGQLSDRFDPEELGDVATAFGRLPTMWQAVLWHRWIERAPRRS